MARKQRRAGAPGRDTSNPTSAEAGQSSADPAESAGQRIRRILEEKDVTARLIQLVHDTYGPGALLTAWDEFRCCDTDNDRGTLLELTAESPFLPQFTSWLAHTWTPPEKLSRKRRNVAVSQQVPAQVFLARHPDLDPLLVKYLRACIDTRFSFFEVLSCEPGRRFTCWDLICSGQHLVLESEVSTLLRVGQLLYARIVEVDGVPVMDAAAPWPLPEDLKPAILALRKVILERPSGFEPMHARQRLLAHELDLRSFYWGFIEQGLWGDFVQPSGLSPTKGQH